MFEWVRCICNGFNAYYSMMARKKNSTLLTFPSLSTTLTLSSCRKASSWCVTFSSCAGPHTATCPTPRKPSLAFWLRFTTGRGSVERDAPSSTACESTYIHLESRPHTRVLTSASVLMWVFSRPEVSFDVKFKFIKNSSSFHRRLDFSTLIKHTVF